MSRAIVVAAAVFALAALILHRAVFKGPFTEPALLLTIGSFFLLASRMVGAERRSVASGSEDKPALITERQRASA